MTVIATVAGASASSGSSNWKLGYYNTSGRALSMSSVPSGSALATFNFTTPDNTALLVTTQGSDKSSLLGDDTGLNVSATATISGLTGAFTYYGEPSCGGTTAYVRYFFTTSKSGGFDETQYWWSNPVSAALTANGSVTLPTVSFDGSNWSDFYGHFGTDPLYSDGFNAAVSDVTTIGLSFGGGCFFENGVGTTDGSGTFTLNTFAVTP
ncbi:MAG: hypothetical protein WAL84_15680 [Candidatus Dormiibacterota bacterium]